MSFFKQKPSQEYIDEQINTVRKELLEIREMLKTATNEMNHFTQYVEDNVKTSIDNTKVAQEVMDVNAKLIANLEQKISRSSESIVTASNNIQRLEDKETCLKQRDEQLFLKEKNALENENRIITLMNSVETKLNEQGVASAEMRITNQKLQDLNEQAARKLSNLEKKLTEFADNQVRDKLLRNTQDNLKVEEDNIEKRNQVLKTQTEKLNSREEEIQGKEKKVISLLEATSKQADDASKLYTNVQLLEKNLAIKTEDFSKKFIELENREKNVSKMEVSITRLAEERGKIEKAISLLSLERDTLKERNTIQEKELKERTESLLKLLNKTSTELEHIKQEEIKQNIRNEQLNSKELKLEKLQTKLTSWQAELDELDKARDIKTKELESIQTEIFDRQNTLKKAFEPFEGKLKEEEKRLIEWQKSLLSKETEIVGYNRTVNLRESNFIDLQEQLKSQMLEMENEKKSLLELRNTHETLIDEKRRTEVLNAHLKTQLQEREKELAKLRTLTS